MADEDLKNVSMKVENGEVIIKCKVNADYGRSKSGKSTIVATTSGIVGIPGTSLKMGLNVFK